MWHVSQQSGTYCTEVQKSSEKHLQQKSLRGECGLSMLCCGRVTSRSYCPTSTARCSRGTSAGSSASCTARESGPTLWVPSLRPCSSPSPWSPSGPASSPSSSPGGPQVCPLPSHQPFIAAHMYSHVYHTYCDVIANAIVSSCLSFMLMNLQTTAHLVLSLENRCSNFQKAIVSLAEMQPTSST